MITKNALISCFSERSVRRLLLKACCTITNLVTLDFYKHVRDSSFISRAVLLITAAGILKIAVLLFRILQETL
jgi:hypothetical protein